MNTIRLNDNFIINIDHIYSLQCVSNDAKYKEWNTAVQAALSSDSFKKFAEKNINNIDTNSIERIYDIIESQIGPCPPIEKQYIITLNTGITIDVDEKIYNIINNTLESYRIDHDIRQNLE